MSAYRELPKPCPDCGSSEIVIAPDGNKQYPTLNRSFLVCRCLKCGKESLAAEAPFRAVKNWNEDKPPHVQVEYTNTCAWCGKRFTSFFRYEKFCSKFCKDERAKALERENAKTRHVYDQIMVSKTKGGDAE